ncbi:glycosyltransferase family 4 protein [Glaciibacter flavus]|uniref:glycosyltransferase family 4 protein n=1 Tax=Orlajensenia flava TaxID=2565934 RepID=UPI003AFFD1DB
MTTLRVVLEQLIAPSSDAISQYSAQLASAIVTTAPAGCSVDSIVSAATDDDVADVRAAVPGLGDVRRSRLASRELALAWQFGAVGSAASGLVHSPSLLAPLRKHSRSSGDQTTVTVHDVLAWTNPSSLTPTAVGWHKAMLHRARKHADAVVVRSHSLAVQLAEIADFGDRIRVVPGGGRSELSIPAAAHDRATALGLPSQYLLAEGTLDEREGIEAIAEGLERAKIDVPLLILGTDMPTTLPDEQRRAYHSPLVRFMGGLDAADTAVVLSGAAAFVFPSREEGFGAPLLDAMRFGVPTVHSDDPALVELGGGAGLVVDRTSDGDYPDRLAAAIEQVLSDSAFAERLRVAGSDRSSAFDWQDAGARIWQLHADL